MIFGVTYYLELYNAIIVYCATFIYFILFYQPCSNRLFEHYRTLASLLDKQNIDSKKI